MTLDGERAFIFHPDPPEGFLEKLKACSGLDVSMELVMKTTWAICPRMISGGPFRSIS